MIEIPVLYANKIFCCEESYFQFGRIKSESHLPERYIPCVVALQLIQILKNLSTCFNTAYFTSIFSPVCYLDKHSNKSSGVAKLISCQTTLQSPISIDFFRVALTEQKLRKHARKLVTLSPFSSLQQIPKLGNT